MSMHVLLLTAMHLSLGLNASSNTSTLTPKRPILLETLVPNVVFIKGILFVQEPLESYHISDIEAGLGLKRKHLIAISLLVGNDHDLKGVQGIGVNTAINFVKCFSEDEVLDRLGRGDNILSPGNISSEGDSVSRFEKRHEPKLPHCSLCGHPGNKTAHLKSACQYCISVTGEFCIKKPQGFKCNCTACNLDREAIEKQKKENWHLEIHRKIALESNFPNSEIVDMYLRDNNAIDDVNRISWENPKTELLIDFLAYYLPWKPSYIRGRLFPFLSTVFLRDMSSNPDNNLLYGQYKFHSIQRVKVRFGHQLYVVKWQHTTRTLADDTFRTPQEPNAHHELWEAVESADLLDEPDIPQIYTDSGSRFLLTDEDVELVQNAFPQKVNEFLKEKELKEMKPKGKKTHSEPQGVQRSITEFYRSSKAVADTKPQNAAESSQNTPGAPESESGSPESERKQRSPNFSKSARRRLLFE